MLSLLLVNVVFTVSKLKTREDTDTKDPNQTFCLVTPNRSLFTCSLLYSLLYMTRGANLSSTTTTTFIMTRIFIILQKYIHIKLNY